MANTGTDEVSLSAHAGDAISSQNSQCILCSISHVAFVLISLCERLLMMSAV